MSIKSALNKFSAYMMPYVLLKNEGKTIVVGGTMRRTPNVLVNDWDLDGYEIHGNPTEIIGPSGLLGKMKSGIGYICDETGVTVSLSRQGPKLSEKQSADNVELILNFYEKMEYKLKTETVPFILISNNGITLTWGGFIRKKGMLLTDGPGKPTYRIMGDTVEIVNLVSGKSGMGYVCDETGVTVDIKKEFKIQWPEKLRQKFPDIDKVNITVRFSGAIGRLITFEKIPEIFNVGQSKKNFYFGLIAGLAIMFMIRLVF